LIAVTLTTACNKADSPKVVAVPDAGPPKPTLISAGPRLLSNQTSQPITVLGERLTPELKLHLGPPVDRALPLTVLDAQHAFTRLPAGIALPKGRPEAAIDVTLEGGAGKDTLRLVNDTDFPDLVAFALCPDGKTAFVVDTPGDRLLAVDLTTRAVDSVEVADGPTAIAAFVDEKKEGRVAVVHRFSPRIDVVSCLRPYPKISFPAPANAEAVLVSEKGNVAFVAEHARDTVAALVLPEAGREKWRTPVAANPRNLALGDALYVGSLQTGELFALDPNDGKPLRALQPGPGTPIIGGGTAKFGERVMNGTAVRGLVYSAKQKLLFLSSIGPNIGPNPEKMEVSMNGGVAAVDGTKGKWLRHLGFGAGVTEGLAIDDARGLVYAADIGVGLVRVLDAKALAGSDATAAKALKQELAVPVLDGFPRFRPATDLGVNNRAGESLYSGPKALALTPDNKTLVVLNRHTGTLALFDVSKANEGKASFTAQLPLTDMLSQSDRRLGQVLYDADVGRTAMSCDACHVEGHTGGIFFEKTMPMRIYRSTTVRGSRETPPYFTPASTHSMGETSKVVGGRNRYHNPDPSPKEIDALTQFSSCIPLLPNPFVGEDGAPVESLALPDGKVGHPRAGLELFYGKADCVRCHPPPQYTLDQDAKTRGKYLDVGTPHLMPLRPAMQNPHFEGFAPPALAGSWDIFPMLTTASAGLGPDETGQLVVKRRDPMAQAITDWAPAHGRADLLSEQEKTDLIAFVMSL
jgi:DNA-binding beta-propeller fold protein YncE